jgi:hypothetical protein
MSVTTITTVTTVTTTIVIPLARHSIGSFL